MPGCTMTVQDAIVRAKEYLKTVLPEYADADWHLEEVETADHRGNWLLTFSAIRQPAANSENSLAAWLRSARVTKSVELAQTGELLAVRNRAA